MRRPLCCLLLAGALPLAQAGSGPSGPPSFSLQCKQRCELVCEENGSRTSYPASGRVEVFALPGGTQLVRLNDGRWLRLGLDSNCLFDGFE
jgi:hypothetical protein